MLSNSQRALLAAQLRRRAANTPTAGIPRRPAGLQELPLSFGQEQLWFIDQLAPGLSTYNIAGAVRMAGPLDRAALSAALDALVVRHEALRTRLVTIDSRPSQVVDAPAPVQVATADLREVPAESLEERWRAAAVEEGTRPFVLDRGPLLRVLLLRLADEAHVLVVTVHHTVFDGWSFPVLLAELAELYEAAAVGRESTLPELPVQFADFALWERGRLQGETLDELVAYWRETLAGASVLQLPTDRPRPLVQTYDGATEADDFGDTLLTALTALGRAEGATLFMTLIAAFHVLLHRYSGQDDIVVGTVSANRGRPELETLIGYLINTLPIRVDLSGDPAFPEVLERVRTATVGAYAHQELPFAKIVEAARAPRDPSRSPLFQVGFMLADNQQRDLTSAELIWASEELPTEAAKFDLLVSAVETAGRLNVGITYAKALFDAATVRRLLGHFRVLLDGIVADPGTPLSRLPILTEAELRQEIVEWNDTRVEFPAGNLHQKFEERAAAHPDAIAVELDGATVTYAELNAQANRIARRLRELGVGPEVLVGVSTQRTPRRLAGLLGILKAGGGYVPLDPDYPADRLSFMVEDAQVPVVVTDDASEAAVPAGSVAVLSLDRDWAELSGLDGSDLDAAAGPANVAYVIYTSGSTGRPKGVVVEHRQAVNFATAEIEHWPLGPGDRVLQFASLNFDVSVLDIFGALLSGATLVLGTPETLLSPPRLAELIRGEAITFMCLPPAVLNLLADEQFPSLRVVIAGGEAFSSELVRSWARPGMRFINGYGPTETTVGSTMAECHDNGIDPPPIGLPLTNYTAYVLDKHLNPVPVGVAGELHIGGAGVTRGYLNRPELTAERFVTDPFGELPDARMYKTGDLARRLPDGNLQFLGRFDDQVKIRGLRVELGEIEAVLASHPSVAQAAILVVEDRAGQKNLVGYARTAPDAPAVTQAELRVHLAELLPAFMVPTHLVILDTFPLNANGKVDRSALPSPDSADPGADYVAPRTLVETVLVDMYASVLNLERVGIENNFFDLGGNSLQAMQLITRLRKDLAVDTDVTAIFLAPTPAQLTSALTKKHGLEDTSLHEVDLDELAQLSEEEAAELLASVETTGQAPAGAAGASGPLVALTEGPGAEPLYVVHAVGGTVFPYIGLAQELADRYRVFGVEAAGVRPGGVPAADLDTMVTEYAGAIRAAQPAGPYRLAGWSMGGLVALEIARRFEAEGEEVALVGLLDTPIEPPDVSGASERDFAAQFVLDAARALGPDAGDPPDRETATVAEQLRWLGDKLTAGSGDPDEVRRDIEARFEVFTAHLALIGGHRPVAPKAAAVVVGADGSPDLSERWQAVLGAGTRTLRVPGDHYSFLRAPGVRAVAAAIR
ncbi:amino acid adenylation domain-containing protein [Streptomyces sp. DvalAA-14]|uniref:non-ribosomal peptide synthetase n=1 Tax=unclassified Streptomyces TaxID=2593676 RepID=UPI00081B41F9|nr:MULTISPECIES: non-ribosomal peptide synthetase [unclassified Streptomyces]MYS19643.1 amino acid adenylation domain-containing protein [Streptomyces sp. SID4948]SCD49555.1 amino acid adenylation domain-containing protein [Streptomyces sp. DvalAA-14]